MHRPPAPAPAPCPRRLPQPRPPLTTTHPPTSPPTHPPTFQPAPTHPSTRAHTDRAPLPPRRRYGEDLFDSLGAYALLPDDAHASLHLG